MLKAQKIKVRDIAITGVLITLVFSTTMFISIPLPFSIHDGGLMHLGNVSLFIAAIVFDKKKGAIAGAFGMSLFNLLSPLGLVIWAPFTFVIRGVMGYVIGTIAEKGQGKNIWINIAAIAVGGAVQIAGYYIAEWILYGNPISPLLSIPGDVVQIVASSVIALPLLTILRRYRERFTS
ncbi:MAG: ECF transporter S component [Defluviitaleaceae bacterium]|nr:ECF transporter S component [Defluviitaleaceae bacterium]MCL2836583.1 ECF transporter S component [Defluviitaleaceae bacterium]